MVKLALPAVDDGAFTTAALSAENALQCDVNHFELEGFTWTSSTLTFIDIAAFCDATAAFSANWAVLASSSTSTKSSTARLKSHGRQPSGVGAVGAVSVSEPEQVFESS